MGNEDIVSDLFKDSCIELFESHQCDVNQVSDSDINENGQFSAMIDATSDDLEILLLINISYSILALTYPITNVLQVSEQELEDWILEISNMLMGKVKGKLIKYDCNINLGLPDSYYDIDRSELLPSGANKRTFYFLIDNEPFECNVVLKVFNKEFDLQSKLGTVVDDSDEGELELF